MGSQSPAELYVHIGLPLENGFGLGAHASSSDFWGPDN
jgi:hypothetical protein